MWYCALWVLPHTELRPYGWVNPTIQASVLTWWQKANQMPAETAGRADTQLAATAVNSTLAMLCVDTNQACHSLVTKSVRSHGVCRS